MLGSNETATFSYKSSMFSEVLGKLVDAEAQKRLDAISAKDTTYTVVVEENTSPESAEKTKQDETQQEERTALVATDGNHHEESNQSTQMLRAKAFYYSGKAKALSFCAAVLSCNRKQLFENAQDVVRKLPNTVAEVRTNLSSFYASFDVNQYVDTDKLKLNSRVWYYNAKSAGFTFCATALSYSEKFLEVVQKVYTQVVKSASEHFSK